MEARKPKTIDDLLLCPDERVELIGGEIVRPGHERKNTLDLFLLLQRQRVSYYRIVWPEDRVLIAHQLDGASYRVVATISDQAKAKIPPFGAIELDLAYILGD